MKTLHLNLKKEYFDAIKSGVKKFEYRRRSQFWKRIIEGKDFKRVLFKSGYPPAGDPNRELACFWLGYEIQTITHPHFGPEPVEVYAIRVGMRLL